MKGRLHRRTEKDPLPSALILTSNNSDPSPALHTYVFRNWKLFLGLVIHESVLLHHELNRSNLTRKPISFTALAILILAA
jgi:hypothetical protein